MVACKRLHPSGNAVYCTLIFVFIPFCNYLVYNVLIIVVTYIDVFLNLEIVSI